jgi:putative colanic acid biosynthesis UDP-glucose lipid carrier transferase
MLPSPLGGQLRQHGKDLSRLQRLIDLLAPAALFQLFNPDANLQPLLLPSWVWVLALTLVLLPSAGLYSSYRSSNLLALARRVTRAWLLVLSTLLLLVFVTRTSTSFSRLDSSLWALSSWLCLLLTHVGLRRLLRWHRSRGGNIRTILYWGTPENAKDFQQQLLSAPWMGLRMVVWFNPVPISPDGNPPNLPPCSGGLLEMRRWLELNSVDAIVFSHVPRNNLTMDQLLQFFGDICLPVIYAPAWARSGMRFVPDQIGEIHCIDLWGGERSLIDRQAKRALDLLVAGSGLLIISPLLLIITIAIATTSAGPVLFVQDRYGLDGKRFRIFKFRTMRVLEAGDQPGLRQATRDDPRITPLGRFLRRWSLDELPQLLNVIRGEMSLVGPRPHAVDHNEQYRRLIPGYMQRHASKPGITGLAQVEGWRGETSDLQDMARRIDADLRYQRDWTLSLDIKILLMTILRLRSPQAY